MSPEQEPGGGGGGAVLTGDHVGTKEDPGGGDEGPEHHHEADEQPQTSSCRDTRGSVQPGPPRQQEAEPGWNEVLAAGEEELTCPAQTAFAVRVSSHLPVGNSVDPAHKTCE